MAGKVVAVSYHDFSKGWLENFKATVVSEAIDAYARYVVDLIKKSFGSEGGSKVGTTRNGNAIYVAAPAGAYPGIRSGALRDSIGYNKLDNMEYEIGTHLAYGGYLERGTSKMASRPWLKRSMLAESALAVLPEEMRARLQS